MRSRSKPSDERRSPSKRPKLNHHPQQDLTAGVASKMYNFSQPNFIDLTNGNGPASLTTVQKKPVVRSSATPTASGPKKLVVKHVRKKSLADPETYFNQVRLNLDAALSAIFSDSERIPRSNEELYKGVEHLCKQGRAATLFGSLVDKCGEGISSQFGQPLLARASTLDDIAILRAVTESWAVWKARLKTIQSIFFFLDRSYLLHTPSLPSIEEMGTTQFRNQIFSHPTLKPRILTGACNLMAVYRQGDLTGKDTDLLRSENGTSTSQELELLKKAIAMFQSLAVYTSDFEPNLLGLSSKYYATWSDEKAETLDLLQYIEESHELIDLEMQRCDMLGLDSTTRKSLESYLEDLLVVQHGRRRLLLDTMGVSQLLREDRRDTLKKLYELLQRRDLCEKLQAPFEAYILEDGSQIVFDEAREHEMVIRLLNFRKKLDTIWKYSFYSHEKLDGSLRRAFDIFLNKTKRSNMTWGTDNPKPGEMIAKYIDLILKGGLRTASTNIAPGRTDNEGDAEAEATSNDEDVEMSKVLDDVLELFRFVHGKAVFEAFYKRDLARRLLLQRSASDDAEKNMLTRLTSECGAGFTQNLETMFKDMELARGEVLSYKSMLEERDIRPGVDLNVNVLSASAWPSYPDVPLVIPPEVQDQQNQFQHHYLMRHSGRKLTWKHSLAHCQLKANFPKGNKELVVSSYQAVVLLIFKDTSANDEISYDRIQAETGLDDVELKRTLQSLACAKYKVLRKTPKGKEVDNTDTFSVNVNFTDPKYRIKINQIQAKETKAENKETHERVAADRAYETQAAIVRIMKTEKIITHAELVAKVISATMSRGVLDAADIKKNIEKLIEKEYIDRDTTETEDGRRNVYKYVT